MALKPGQSYTYPRGDLNGEVGPYHPPHEKVITAEYFPDLYGDSGPLGGTQTLYLSAVPFNTLGLPYGQDRFGRDIPDHAYARETEGVQHFLYSGLVAPVTPGGERVTITVTWRNSRRHHHEIDEDE